MKNNQEASQQENSDKSVAEDYDDTCELSDFEKGELFLEEAERERERVADAFFDSGMSVKEWQESKGRQIWFEIERKSQHDK